MATAASCFTMSSICATPRRRPQQGVDGIIAVCAGAGGHAGVLSPFALVKQIREVYPGTIILSGAMSTGADVLAAQALGADLAYLGTRFIATEEANASDGPTRRC